MLFLFQFRVPFLNVSCANIIDRQLFGKFQNFELIVYDKLAIRLHLISAITACMGTSGA